MTTTTDPLLLICHNFFENYGGLKNVADKSKWAFYRAVKCIQSTVSVPVHCTGI